MRLTSFSASSCSRRISCSGTPPRRSHLYSSPLGAPIAYSQKTNRVKGARRLRFISCWSYSHSPCCCGLFQNRSSRTNPSVTDTSELFVLRDLQERVVLNIITRLRRDHNWGDIPGSCSPCQGANGMSKIFKLKFSAVFIVMLASVFAMAQYDTRDQGQYRIVNARYGTERNNVDVTARLRDLARQDYSFRMGNSTFGVDPAPGQVKTLRIVARGPRGETRTFDYREGSVVDGRIFSDWRGGGWGGGQGNGHGNGRGNGNGGWNGGGGNN